MRITVFMVALVLGSGCSSEDPPKIQKKAEPSATEKDTPGPDKSQPAARPAAAAPAKPTVDCDALLPAADIKEVCGQEGKWSAGVTEGQGSNLCSRKTGKPGTQLYFIVEYHADEKAARVRTAEVEEGQVTYRVSKGGGGMTTESAFARKGNVAVILNNQLVGAGKKAMCNAKQTSQLAERVASRLP